MHLLKTFLVAALFGACIGKEPYFWIL